MSCARALKMQAAGTWLGKSRIGLSRPRLAARDRHKTHGSRLLEFQRGPRLCTTQHPNSLHRPRHSTVRSPTIPGKELTFLVTPNAVEISIKLRTLPPAARLANEIQAAITTFSFFVLTSLCSLTMMKACWAPCTAWPSSARRAHISRIRVKTASNLADDV